MPGSDRKLSPPPPRSRMNNPPLYKAIYPSSPLACLFQGNTARSCSMENGGWHHPPWRKTMRKNMRYPLYVAILLVTFSLTTLGHAAADGTIGVVRTSAGSATVTLRDNSSISLGPGSSLVLREFLFSPSEGKLGLLVRLSKGTMAYLSGLIGKLAPEKARFETPGATIGIRGTHFAVMAGDSPTQ